MENLIFICYTGNKKSDLSSGIRRYCIPGFPSCTPEYAPWVGYLKQLHLHKKGDSQL